SMLRTWWNWRCPSRRPLSRRAARGRIERRPFLEALERRLAPATHTWIGGTASNVWSNDANWAGGAPVVGEMNVVLIFPNSPNLTSTNDIANLTVQSLTFTAGGYTVNGSAFTLTSGITVDTAVTAGTETFNTDITLGAAPTFTVANTETTLTMA